jgi:hypothetical protein
MARTKIEFVNESTVITDKQAKAVLDPLQIQVHRDFAPAWGIDADLSFVPKGAQPSGGSWWIGFFDNSDQAGALGYHDLTNSGLPVGKVFVESDLQSKSSWTNDASHELLEMLGDPDINLAAYKPEGKKVIFYAHEVCDACEDDRYGYKIGGVLVSDFVFPSWFEGFRKEGSTQFDFGKHITKPFQLLPGGYIGVLSVDSGRGWHQVDYDASPRYVSRPRLGSRRQRRSMAREEWQLSRVRRTGPG